MTTWEEFVRWFRSVVEPQPPEPASDKESLERKVLVVNFDPRCPAGDRQPLSSVWKERVWTREHRALESVDALVDGFTADVFNCSGEQVTFKVVQSIVVDGWPVWPVKKQPFCYDWETYLRCLEAGSGWHEPDLADYDAILRDFGILQRIEAKRIDEVWLFGFPYAGFHESIMGGPRAFDCNAGGKILRSPGVSRRFIVMGFSWERGVGEMLEDLGHRFEACLAQTWKDHPGDENLWARFTQYGPHAAGGANVGSVHHGPNSLSDEPNDHDWASTNSVLSTCDNWLKFPNLKGKARLVDCKKWGGIPGDTLGSTRPHHIWWFEHLPRVAGQTFGVANNWWLYGIDPNRIP